MPAERLSIAVSESCSKTFRELAKQHNTTVSAEIRAALKVYIDEVIESTTENALIDGYENRITALEQRLKDKDEIIRAKDETIAGLKLVIALEPMEPYEGTTDTSKREDSL
jgi:hypothetical protein